MADREKDFESLRDRLGEVELRLEKLEAALAYSGLRLPAENLEPFDRPGEKPPVQPVTGEDRGLESRIGRFGLAWMGNIVLLFGIAFLVQYLMNMGKDLAGGIIGLLAVAGLLFFSVYLKKSNQHLSFIFRINSQALLFYVMLRLHFFSPTPFVHSRVLAILLLILTICLQVYLAVQERSQGIGAFAILFGLMTALLSDSASAFIPLMCAMSVLAVIWLRRYDWKALFVITIFLSYTAFFIWLIGDPVMGHAVGLIKSGYLGVICLFFLGGVYSSVLFFRKKDKTPDAFLTIVAAANGFLFTLLLLIIVPGFFRTSYVPLFAGISAGCLIYSVILHSRSDWNFGSAFFALYGFMALSISIYGLVGFPDGYILLSLQSLLVVSMALWFRNRLIVLMNSLLFLLLLAGYLVTSKPDNGANFSFALVALVTARVINWQKTRLRIETDLIRNLYLIEGFVMVLIALIHAVPKHFITFSWTMAALVYFLLSIILKNVKYRYMALGTVICAALYLFLVDLARIDLVYRILALLFLASISIGISIYYTNRTKRSAG